MCVFKISIKKKKEKKEEKKVLLYTDDTVVIAECPEDLQRALDMLKMYCEFWGLDINVRKTKVMIFSRGKIRKMPKFKFNDFFDVVWYSKYLGVNKI